MTTAAGKAVRVAVCFPPDPEPALLDHIRSVDPRIEVVAAPYFETHDQRAARGAGRQAPDAEVTAQLRHALAGAEAILAIDLPSGAAELAPRLRWLQVGGAGVDHLRGRGLPADLVVTNAVGVAAPDIAEFVIARVLGVWKRVPESHDAQRQHRWGPLYGRRLAGCTMLVVGLGAIGSEVARRAEALGMDVLGIRRSPVPHPYCRDVAGTEALVELLGQADVVVLSAPATAETMDLFDADAFAAMRRGAVFCNVARGSMVDEVALVHALESGQLGAAILDVTKQEPLPADSPLWDVPDLYLSSHASSVQDTYRADVVALFADNLGRWLRGESLRNVVDLARGY